MAQKELNGEEKKLSSVLHQLNWIHTSIFSSYLASKPFYGQKEINSFFFIYFFLVTSKSRSQLFWKMDLDLYNLEYDIKQFNSIRFSTL